MVQNRRPGKCFAAEDTFTVTQLSLARWSL
jgi:hypothetical protein